MAISTPSAMTAEEIVALSRQYTLYEWSAQNAVDPIAVERAEGVYFYSPDGKRYIDFNSQLMSVNIGHGDARVVDLAQCVGTVRLDDAQARGVGSDVDRGEARHGASARLVAHRSTQKRKVP